jgi:hypothetical protein
VRLDAELVRVLSGIGVPPETTPPPQVTLKQFQSPEAYFWIPLKQTLDDFGIRSRMGHSAVVQQERAFFFGGCDIDGANLSDGNLFVRYDLNSTIWHLIGGPDILVRSGCHLPRGDLRVWRDEEP